MTEFLEINIDKFFFKVASDRLYSQEGVWAKVEEANGSIGIRVGLSDFLQQRSGDVAFAEVKPEGSAVVFGEEIATVETIKVNVSLSSPADGKVAEVNPAMETAPEAINQDPYGEGWLAVITPDNWEADRARLLDARAYFERMKTEAEREARRP